MHQRLVRIRTYLENPFCLLVSKMKNVPNCTPCSSGYQKYGSTNTCLLKDYEQVMGTTVPQRRKRGESRSNLILNQIDPLMLFFSPLASKLTTCPSGYEKVVTAGVTRGCFGKCADGFNPVPGKPSMLNPSNIHCYLSLCRLRLGNSVQEIGQKLYTKKRI